MNATDVKSQLQQSIQDALETYSNVHRGSGHKSIVTTHIFEEARKIVLDYLDLNPGKYTLVFCSPLSAKALKSILNKAHYQELSADEFNMRIGVHALAIKKNKIPGGSPLLPGGGTTKLISGEWVIWDKAPARYEPGTPAVINIVAFTRLLQLVKKHGKKVVEDINQGQINVNELLYSDPILDNEGLELYNKLLDTRIGKELKVPVVNGESRFINFDSAASTTTFRPVRDAFVKSLFLNKEASAEILEEVKNVTADFIQAPRDTYDHFFVSNTTEGINLVADALNGEHEQSDEKVVVTTVLEHSSNDLPWRKRSNDALIRLTVDKEGLIDKEALAKLLKDYNENHLYGRKRITLVTISGASNVIGTCNDLGAICKIAHDYGAKVCVDAAQLVAHRQLRMLEDGIDCLVFSGHKIYAPFGGSIVVARKGLMQLQQMDFQMKAVENAAGIAALGTSLYIINRIGIDNIEEIEKRLMRKLIEGMQALDGMQIFGISGTTDEALSKRVGSIAFNYKKLLSFRVGKELAARHGIGIRVGCHCAHIIVKHILGVGPGLERFQRVIQTLFPAVTFPGVARASIGIENTEEDIDALIHAIKNLPEKPSDSAQKKLLSAQMKNIKTYAETKTIVIYS